MVDKVLLASLIQARAMQLYYHYCHNLAYGETFHEDHAFFASAYAELEDDYDSLVEYFISLFSNSKFKTKEVSELVHEQLQELDVEKMDCNQMYSKAVELEEQYQKYLTQVNGKASIGLQNAVQGLATKSDVRLYKMRQKLYGSDDK